MVAIFGVGQTAVAAPVTYDLKWGQSFFGQLPVGTVTVDDADPGFGVSNEPLLDWSLAHPSGVWNSDDTILFGTTPTLYFESGSPVGFTLYSIDDVAPLGTNGLIFQFSFVDGIFVTVAGNGRFLANGGERQFALVPIPLPAALLLRSGLVGLGFSRRHRNKPARPAMLAS